MDWFSQFNKSKYDRLCDNKEVKEEFLSFREKRAKGYPTAKWITFCRYFISLKCLVFLDEVTRPGSKIITVEKKRNPFEKMLRHKRKTCTVLFSLENKTPSSELVEKVIKILGLEVYLENNDVGTIVQCIVCKRKDLWD